MSGAGRRLAIVVLLASVAIIPVVHPAAGQEPATLTGKLLVAAPGMRDPRFGHSVVYLVRHDASGALGLVVNRPLGKVPLARVLDELGIASDRVTGAIGVHWGGPVESGRGFVLHTRDYAGQGTLVVDEHVAVTDPRDVFRSLAAGASPHRLRFILGYAGWAPGQLEDEIARGDWVTVTADEGLLFDDDDADKWERAMARQVIQL